MFDKIFQIQTTLVPGDAIGNNVRDISKVLNTAKIDNYISALHVHPQYDCEGMKRVSLEDVERLLTPNSLIIFHFSGQSDLSFKVSLLQCHKVLLYHNVTPPEFFEDYNTRYFQFSVQGITELKLLSVFFPKAWGDSDYNCSELKKIGYQDVQTLPLICHFDKFGANYPQNPKKESNRKKIIFVGRICPNKKQSDVIRAFYYYNQINPHSELTLVGNYEDFPNYKEELDKLALSYALPVRITGKVSLDELIALYKESDLFLCMSEHEGFCVPLLEAMYFGVPIIAYDSSAVTETLGNAGIIIHEKLFPVVGHLIDTVLSSPSICDKMILSGRKRLDDFNEKKTSTRLLQLVTDYAFQVGL